MERQSRSMQSSPIPVGISPAELISTVMREVEQALQKARGNRRKALQTGLRSLEGRGLVSRQERATLGRICDLAVVANGGGPRGAPARDRLRRLHDALILGNASPVAIAIAGAIVQVPPDTEGVAPSRAVSHPAAAASHPGFGLLGAVIAGAVIGGAIGGLPGGVFGVIGGAAGAVASSFCSDK